QLLNVNEPMQRSGSGGGSGPSTLTGTVVDAASGAPIAGASFNLAGGPGGTTASNGSFSIGSVSGGSYSATVSATGYASQNLSLVVPAGTTASLGTIGLYQSNGSNAPNSVTLLGTVIDGLTN